MEDENIAATWASEAQRKKDIRKNHRAYIKHRIRMLWYAAYWRTLHATRLARPYSKVMCKLGLYRKFPDGRCMWCGIVHD